jgi:hypothetical protein
VSLISLHLIEIVMMRNRVPKIAVVVLVVLLLGAYFMLRIPSFKNELEDTSAALNKTCPMMADENTRLDNTEVVDGNKFQYNYSLVNFLKDSIDIEVMRSGFEPAMIDNCRKNPELELFRKNKITFIYSFKDKLGAFVTKIFVRPEQYQ